ncbi:MAG: PSD1 and planctomycete cytochrome C domain-containing protein [Lentisphaeraceae bacterium]|nr:PSD1 and planctomycete cytochrome C domain-containing protein [Lentisphaeraceae bacterium]
MKNLKFNLLAFYVLLGSSLASEKLAFFESNIRPVLIKHCYKCHSIESGKHKGGLLVDSREALLTGGDSGPSIVPGKSEQSLFIKAISYKDLDLQMPEKKQLPEQVIKDFEKWVRDGAVDPREVKGVAQKRAKMVDGRKNYWSFQSIKKSAFTQKTIDGFLNQKIAAVGLTKSAKAKPESLLRRLYFDLTGLPPTPEEIQNFKSSPTPENYERIAKSLMDSSQFGEKWGRFWLDLVRYSETAGGGRSYPIPITWRYRSYVIDSFNQDKAYDQFLREQIAGDLLEAKNDQDKARNLIATGFMAMGAKPLDLQNKEQLDLDHVDEQLDTLGKSTLGMTIGCARCHDHEFDPITTRDYYRMAAIFQNTDAMTHASTSNITVYGLPGATEERVKAAVKNIGVYRNLGKRITKLEREVQSGNKGAVKEIQQKRQEFARLVKADSQMPVAIALNDKKKFSNAYIHIRGVADHKGDKVERGAPKEFLTQVSAEHVPQDSSGRLQLANWLVAKENPLTSRVYVNRVWAQLFGQGLVRSVDNFGTTGEKPSHPELLDFLASGFMQNSWSTKRLIEKIIFSEAYQRSTKRKLQLEGVDTDNQLLSYYPKRRLQAEALRDSILAISGQLDTTRVDGVLPYDVLQTSNKRSIYLATLREEGRNHLLEVFDFPDASALRGQRTTTNLPSQSLFLMNSPFIINQSALAAQNLLIDSVKFSKEEKLQQAALLVYGRKLRASEKALFEPLLKTPSSEQKVWQTIFHAMFCSVDFRYLD